MFPEKKSHDAKISLHKWESRYSQPDRVWSGEVNPMLAEVAVDLRPGTALDIGCGEGADAIWLAKRGWTVVAMDFARSGLAAGKAAAERAGVAGAIDWRLQDLADWSPVTGSFDLVSVQFFHATAGLRESVHRAAWQATAKTLVIVGHDRTNATEGNGGPPDPNVLYTADEVVRSLDLDQTTAQVIVAERRVRNAHDSSKIMWDCLVVVSRAG